MDSDSDSTGRRKQTYEAVWFPHPSAHSSEGTLDSSVEQNRANIHEPPGAIMGRNMCYASTLFVSPHEERNLRVMARMTVMKSRCPNDCTSSGRSLQK
jgi:hypothetical protein